MLMSTSSFGCLSSSTVKVSVPHFSLVTSPVVGVTEMPAGGGTFNAHRSCP